MRQATLCFLVREVNGEKELLLAMKKKRFGVGKWNGVGGKLDFNKGDKDVFDTAIREMKEEIGVEIKNMERVAILNFHYPYLENSEKEWPVHVFLVKDWEGEPKESKEMRPKWFKVDEIPFDEMWPDDEFWLPKVLNGKKVKAKFIFKPGELIDSYEIKTI